MLPKVPFEIMLDIYISPCPNDTYMFHSLCKGIRKISVPLSFHYLDIAELNQKVLSGVPGVFKLSFATLFRVEDKYQMLNSGAALGYGCGPLLLRRPGLSDPGPDSLIAIPGSSTTAFALLKTYYPFIKKTVCLRFDEIPKQMIEGKIDYGLVIHETRFVYNDLGLELVCDLGELFENDTKAPIPLGVIAVHKSLAELAVELEQAIRSSINDSKRDFPVDFCQEFAQEMDPEVLRNHVKTYVNEFSLDLGERGLVGVNRLREYCRLADS